MRPNRQAGWVVVGVLLGAGCSSPPPAPAMPAASAPGRPAPAPFRSGLVVETLRAGTGTAAQVGDTVKVHYVGTLMDGRKFESSRDRGEPYAFQLGRGAVLAGWDQGVTGMKVGEVRRLTVPPSLGYGASAVGSIPSNATLVFELELVEATRDAGAVRR